jgi:hypothetical protein
MIFFSTTSSCNICFLGNGRIEEYIESTSVPANIFRLQKTACIVASRLARIHALLPNVLGDKNEVFEPDRDYMLSKIEQMSNAAETASLELLNKYESMLKDCHHHGGDKVTQRNYIQCRLEMLQKIMSVNRRKSKNFEHAILQAQASQSPFVLAHCGMYRIVLYALYNILCLNYMSIIFTILYICYADYISYPFL